MTAQSTTITIQTRGFADCHDMTARASEFVESTGIQQGLFCAFVPGSTAGITTIEYEEGVVRDLAAAIERMVPHTIQYQHDARWGDGNGFSHVRAALMGPSLSVPIARGELQLGTWQQIILVDFDNRPRRREVMFQVVGE